MTAADTPQKDKRQLSQVLSKISADQPVLERILKQYFGKHFKRTTNPRGRPVGSLKATDDMITEKMMDVSMDSAKLHTRLLRPIRTLTMSKRRCAKTFPKLLSRSHLCTRLQKCKLGFSPAATQRGKCDCCHAWISGHRKIVAHALKEGRANILAVWPFYFDSDEKVSADEEFVLEPCDDLDHIESLMKFIDEHRHNYPMVRTGMSEEKRLRLEATENVMLSTLEDHLEDIKNYSWHLQLIRTQEILWRASWYAPTAQTTYMLWDNMSLTFFL